MKLIKASVLLLGLTMFTSCAHKACNSHGKKECRQGKCKLNKSCCKNKCKKCGKSKDACKGSKCNIKK